LIKKCNEAPNSTTVHRLAGLISSLPQAHKVIQRDAQGRAKVAASAALDDIARLQEIIDSVKRITPNGVGTPDFSGLQIGDYLDGIDLSAIPAENRGPAGRRCRAALERHVQKQPAETFRV
jgi:hypothetical protein